MRKVTIQPASPDRKTLDIEIARLRGLDVGEAKGGTGGRALRARGVGPEEQPELVLEFLASLAAFFRVEGNVQALLDREVRLR